MTDYQEDSGSNMQSMKQIEELRKALRIAQSNLQIMASRLNDAWHRVDELEQKDRDIVRSYQRWETRPAEGDE